MKEASKSCVVYLVLTLLPLKLHAPIDAFRGSELQLRHYKPTTIGL